MAYPEAELEAVRLDTADPSTPTVVLVYRVTTGPYEGARVRLSAQVGSVQYLDMPDGPIDEEGVHGNRSQEATTAQADRSQEDDGDEEGDEQHCECYECEECPHEELVYCQACDPEEVDEEFWE